MLVPSAVFVASGCVKVNPHSEADVPRRQRGIEVSVPWVAFHGRADQIGDLAKVASTFRLIAVDADPDGRGMSRADLATLRAGGRNIVLGFLNIGFCDRGQSIWLSAPDGLLPCFADPVAHIGKRDGRPNQMWMDPANEEYQRLIVEYVAPRLRDAGVDGFMLDGLDLLDHGPDDDAPCDGDCVGGGLMLLARLRRRFPDMIFLMQGGISRTIREARIGTVPVTSLLDGISAEETYAPSYDAEKEADLLAWKALGLSVNGHPFMIGTQDYVDGCDNTTTARAAYQASRSHQFSPAIGPSPVSRPRVCYWNFGP